MLKPQLERGNNGKFWVSKIINNQRRDDEVNKRLQYMGWTVIRFWGRDILKRTSECVKVVQETIFDLEMRRFEDENSVY